MADTKISGLPSASTIVGTEELPVVQGGANARVAVDTIIANRDLVKVHRVSGTPDTLTDASGNVLTVVNAAPKAAKYVVTEAHADLTNENVIAGSTSVIMDTATPGQIAFKRAAISGAITIAENANTATIPDNTITTAMVQANAIGKARMAKGAAYTVTANPTSALNDLQDVAISANSVLARSSGDIASHTLGGGIYFDSTNIKSKGGYGFIYKFSTTTTMADPGTGFVRANNADITLVDTLVVDNLASSGQDTGIFWDKLNAGGRIVYMSNSVAGAAYGSFDVTSVTNSTGFRTIVVDNGVGTLPANNEECLMMYYPSVGAGLTVADMKTNNFVQVDAQGRLLDGNDAVISGSPAVPTQADLLALNAANYENFAVVVDNGMNNAVMVSDGVKFEPLNGQYIQINENIPGEWYIYPDNVTWTATNNGSGKVRLTASAAHNMAEVDAEGSNLYLISGGTGWTAGTSHKITAGTGYISTTVVDLDTPYTAGMGVPVFARAGNTEATSEIKLKEWTLPLLRANSTVINEYQVEYNDKADVNTRRAKFYIENTELNNHNHTSANTTFYQFRHGFRNQNNAAVQRALCAGGSYGWANSTGGAVLTAAVDTAVAGKKMSIRHLSAIPGLKVRLEHFYSTIRG